MAKILIVEDDIDLSETYQDALETAGHTVSAAHTGTAAMDLLVHRRVAPDVVVLDMQLPGDSGLMILGLIRRMPRLAKTRVIIASGHADIGEWAVTQWGADLFLKKPVSITVLRELVCEFVACAAEPTP